MNILDKYLNTFLSVYFRGFD